MASIKIFDLSSQSFATDLSDSDLKNINGGSCTYESKKYGAGSVVKQGDGWHYRCKDIRFRPDRWEWTGY